MAIHLSIQHQLTMQRGLFVKYPVEDLLLEMVRVE